MSGQELSCLFIVQEETTQTSCPSIESKVGIGTPLPRPWSLRASLGAALSTSMAIIRELPKCGCSCACPLWNACAGATRLSCAIDALSTQPHPWNSSVKRFVASFTCVCVRSFRFQRCHQQFYLFIAILRSKLVTSYITTVLNTSIAVADMLSNQIPSCSISIAFPSFNWWWGCSFGLITPVCLSMLGCTARAYQTKIQYQCSFHSAMPMEQLSRTFRLAFRYAIAFKKVDLICSG